MRERKRGGGGGWGMGGDKQARDFFFYFLNIDSYFKDQTDEGTEKWSEFWF